MNKRKITISRNKLIVAIIIFIAMSIGLGWIFSMSNLFNNIFFGKHREIYSKLGQIESYVNNEYIKDVNENKLENILATAYMKGIDDKYADYYDKDEWDEQKNENKGEIVGIGIVARSNENKDIEIIEVYENSPAWEADIKPGSRLVKIEEVDVRGRELNDVVSRIRGQEGTEVKLTVEQNNSEIEKTLIRRAVEIPSVYCKMRGENGYVKIKSFTENGAQQLKKGIDDLMLQGAKGLIFDLRNNGGGTLSSVTQSLNYILPEGEIGTEVKADGSVKSLGWSDSNEINLPMVALTNEYTASAAELFVCDLKDYNKALLVGDNTYGKGVLQSIITLNDGSAIKLTTAEYNPAKSENFDGKGIEPNYQIGLDNDKKLKLSEGKLEYKEDEQYKKSEEVLNSLK